MTRRRRQQVMLFSAWVFVFCLWRRFSSAWYLQMPQKNHRLAFQQRTHCATFSSSFKTKIFLENNHPHYNHEEEGNDVSAATAGGGGVGMIRTSSSVLAESDTKLRAAATLAPGGTITSTNDTSTGTMQTGHSPSSETIKLERPKATLQLKVSRSSKKNLCKKDGRQLQYDNLVKQQQQRQHKLDLKLLVLDHHDSFTYNLVDGLAACTVEPPTVVRVDAVSSWEDLMAIARSHDQDGWDGIILSPGPGHPDESLYRVSHETVLNSRDTPILGVCLGHQILGKVYGASVDKAKHGPVHGQVHEVKATLPQQRQPDPLFQGLPPIFNVTRYHSLTVDLDGDEGDGNKNGIQLVQTSTVHHQNPNILMSMRHVNNPHWGVQFHPESIGSGLFGQDLLKNFCLICHDHKKIRLSQYQRSQIPMSKQAARHYRGAVVTNIQGNNVERSSTSKMENKVSSNKNQPQPSSTSTTRTTAASRTSAETRTRKIQHPWSVYVHKIPADSCEMQPHTVMHTFLKDSPYSFWLDTQYKNKLPEGCVPSPLSSPPATLGTSILGGGTYNHRVEYFGIEHGRDIQGLWIFNATGDLVERRKRKKRLLDFEPLPKNTDTATSGTTILEYLQEQHHDYEACMENTWIVDDSDLEVAPHDKNAMFRLLTTSLPFDYRGGHVGYLGYEVHHDTIIPIATDNQERIDAPQKQLQNPEVPTAAFLFADRSFVYDHASSDWYLVGVVANEEDTKCIETQKPKNDMLEWMRHTKDIMQQYNKQKKESTSIEGQQQQKLSSTKIGETAPEFRWNRSYQTYQSNIEDCHKYIESGESYELCLTCQSEAEVVKIKQFQSPNKSTAAKLRSKDCNNSALDLYMTLRRRNPAPFSAFFNWNSNARTRQPKTTMMLPSSSSASPATLAICCSSPERFVSVKPISAVDSINSDSSLQHHQWRVEAKPIKGTVARCLTDPEEDRAAAEQLQNCPKNRAENLMIVDLLRNDLTKVCSQGTISVDKLCAIESFQTVHQMVSTISGRLEQNQHGGMKKTAVDVLSALFPGGSMTGAPKQRTVQLLGNLESGKPRGPYSGCLGYLSCNGAADFNILIRSAIISRASIVTESNNKPENITQCDDIAALNNVDENREEWRVHIGAGGAITALSECGEEYEEMLLKASAVTEAVQEWALDSF